MCTKPPRIASSPVNFECKQVAIHDDLGPGQTVIIVGLGNVGRRLAKLCATVFDMTVLAYDPFLDEKTIAERNATKVELDELCRRSDFISINCPLDDTTRNMISTRQFGLMQKHTYFITAARGCLLQSRFDGGREVFRSVAHVSISIATAL